MTFAGGEVELAGGGGGDVGCYNGFEFGAEGWVEIFGLLVR